MKLLIPRGANAFTPIPVGRRADGELARYVVARKEGGVHSLISGQTGAGKTWGETPVLLSCGAMGIDQILIDTVKGIQSYQDVAGCLQMYEIDPVRAKQLIKRLMNNVLPARTNHLAREGLKQWSPKSTLRFLRIHVEEAWRLAGQAELVGLAVALRSAGGQLTYSVQQPTWDSIPTVVRNQMGSFRAYGIADKDYNEYALPEDVVAAGANPAQWGNEDPGMHYLVGPGMTLREKTLPVRSFDDGTGENTFASAAAYVASILGPMDPVNVAALGDLWNTHTPPLELVRQFGAITPGPATKQAFTPEEPDLERFGTTVDQDDDYDPDDPDYLAALEEFYDPDDPEMDESTMVEKDGVITITALDGDEDEFEISLEDPEDAEDLELADPDEPTHPEITKRMIGDPPPDGLTPEEFQEVLTIVVTEWLATGRDRLERRELINIAADSGWSMASVYKRLGKDSRIRKADTGWERNPEHRDEVAA